MEIKIYKSRPHFQEVWSWMDKPDSFCGMTRISRPGRAAAHFFSRPVVPFERGIVEIFPDDALKGFWSETASPALAGME